MLRILFSKRGTAVWSSHLDLMRALHRSFRRAGLMLKHSQGYSPHPELSILLPLSVGVSSLCEIAEFALAEGSEAAPAEIAARLGPVLPAGVTLLDCYEGGRKAGKLQWLRARLELCYDGGVPDGAAAAIAALLARPSLAVEKHSKKGPVEVDIRPMYRDDVLTQADESTLLLEALCSAQNPTLNPLLLAAAVETYLPEWKPDFVRCERLEVYDDTGAVFR